MFNTNNTSGSSQDDIALPNEALEIMMENGIAESNAADIITNNWEPTGNTVDSLTRTQIHRPDE